MEASTQLKILVRRSVFLGPNLAGADLRKKPLRPDLNHSIDPQGRYEAISQGNQVWFQEISRIGRFGEHDVVAKIGKRERVGPL